MVELTVRTGGRSYGAWVGSGLLSRAAELLPELRGAEKAFVVADEGCATRALATLATGLAPRGWNVVHLTIPAGEDAKRLAVVEDVARRLAAAEAHRDDPILALGGGATGDLAGFVAATYMRGVPLVQVPTTLLAMVDASIGGKTAVNLPEGKNLVGAYHQPVAVIADLDLLSTLPDRDLRSGLAEVAKVALALRPDLLDRLVADADALLRREVAALEPLVAASVSAKADVVAEDERDDGRRLHLNYGHTLGHALERLDGFSGRTHGEAVAVGIRFAAILAARLGIGAPSVVDRTEQVLTALGLGAVSSLPPSDEVVAAMRMDKKYAGGLRFVLLEDVGRPRVVDAVGESDVRAALAELGADR